MIVCDALIAAIRVGYARSIPISHGLGGCRKAILNAVAALENLALNVAMSPEI